MKRLFVLLIAFVFAICPTFSQKREPGKVKTIVIDPGHGGDKPGAIGKKAQEKDITLSVALKFGKLITDNYPDVNIIYTRTTDVDITLAERARIANRNKADLFLSIHANSCPSSSPTGVESFVMGRSQSKSNMDVAKKENADILLEAGYKNNSDYQGFDPNSPESYVMFAMYQNAYLDKSLNFAKFIQDQYKVYLHTIDRGVKQAEFIVLYKTAMPAVLTEIGFISNPEEEAYMMSDEGQARIAISLFNAFATYKAIEEGTKKPEKPVINLPGYGANKTTTAKNSTAKAQEQPAAQKVKEEAEKVKAEPKEEAAVAETPKPAAPAETAENKPAAKPESGTQEKAAKEQVKQQPVNPPAPEPSPEQIALDSAKAQQNILDKALYAAIAVSRGEEVPIVERPADTRKQELPSQEAREAAARQRAEEQSQAAADRPAANTQQQQSKPANNATQKSNASQDRVIYKIQFLRSDKELKAGDRELKGVSSYEMYRNGSAYCYTVGSFTTTSAAKPKQSEMRNMGFQDAFIVAFYRGQRISIQQARDMGY